MSFEHNPTRWSRNAFRKPFTQPVLCLTAQCGFYPAARMAEDSRFTQPTIYQRVTKMPKRLFLRIPNQCESISFQLFLVGFSSIRIPCRCVYSPALPRRGISSEFGLWMTNDTTARNNFRTTLYRLGSGCSGWPTAKTVLMWSRRVSRESVVA